MLEYFRRNQVLLSASLCLFLSFALLTLNRGGLRRVDPLGVVFLEVLSPLQGIATAAVERGRGLWFRYVSLIGIEEENRELRGRLRELEAERHRAAEIELQNERFQELLKFRSDLPGKAITARVTGQDASGWFQTFAIDRGQRDGVQPGMPVVCADGVVGRIAQASPHASRVLLISDHNSGLDALVQRTRARGIVEGAVNGVCSMKYIKRSDDIEVGDVVVTSGLDGIFPKGILVGRVIAITRKDYGLFQVADVVPSVDFSRLEEVLVITSPPAEARSATEPPRP
jgi:rod shape-determining protein MreC